MVKLLVIGAGGFMGAIARFAVASFMSTYFKKLQLPLATLFVNVLGSFLIGYAAEIAAQRLTHQSATYLFMVVGFLGAFTTFSTFSAENLALLRAGKAFFAVANVFLHVSGGLIAAWAGYAFALANTPQQ